MSTTTAREVLDVNLKRLYWMIDAGKIPAYRIGRVIRLRRKASRSWMDGGVCRSFPALHFPALLASIGFDRGTAL